MVNPSVQLECRLRKKIDQDAPLRVFFLNDLGFQYGAGIAQLRQIQSFLLLGHEVQALCWRDEGEYNHSFVPPNAPGRWLGMRQRPDLHKDFGLSEEEIVKRILEEVGPSFPDLIIAGNLHGSGWPLRVLKAFQQKGSTVICYLHDCFYFTGRCTHPFSCNKFEKGCDFDCPTQDRYPQLSPSKINEAWNLRQQIFSGSEGLFLATNSQWTKRMACRAIPSARDIETIYLGLDLRMFQPIDKTLAKKMLGIPTNDFVLLGGAVNVNDPHKGGGFFAEAVAKLKKDCTVLVFGAESSILPDTLHTGLIWEYWKMPLIYSAADIFFSTSMAESFGQTFCEAAACAVPIVSFATGGIPEIARHQTNALLTTPGDVGELIKMILQLKKDPHKMRRLGEQGRQIVASEFSLESQASRWDAYLKKLVHARSDV